MHERELEEKLLAIVGEDVSFGDITTAFTPEKTVNATIVAKDDGIVSGIHELQVLFRLFGIDAKTKLRDGGNVKNEQVVFALKGSSRDILIVERTALNILSRMSGISTLTKKYVAEAGRHNKSVKIAATRKTTPLFGYFEKKAVKEGGGDTHRLGLGDEVLIKDNHLRLFKDVRHALEIAKKETSFAHKIEIEVNGIEDALLAAKNGADVIMLDNMLPEKIEKTVRLLKDAGLRDKVLLEVSGGLDLKNLGRYAKTGIDVLSIGRLTHSAPALDYSLEIVE